MLFLIVGFIAIPKGKAISNNYRPLTSTDVNKIFGKDLELKIEFDSSFSPPFSIGGSTPLIAFIDHINRQELSLFLREGPGFNMVLELVGIDYEKTFWSEALGEYLAIEHIFSFATQIEYINNQLINSGLIYVCDKLTPEGYIEIGRQQGYTTGYQEGVRYTMQQLDLETIQQSAYDEGYNFGYAEGLEVNQDWQYDNGWYSGYAKGYNLAKEQYGIEIESVWKTATEYGTDQYNLGVSSEFNGFNAIISAVFLFISGIGNIEILPGIKMGYVIGLFLIFGIIAFLTRGGKK